MKHTKQGKHPDPLKEKKDVPANPDKHIDQDFQGYPHHPSNDETIKPGTTTQKKTAGIIPKNKHEKKL